MDVAIFVAASIQSLLKGGCAYLQRYLGDLYVSIGDSKTGFAKY
jgi:hypothetical protein